MKQQLEHDIKTRPWQAFKENFQVGVRIPETQGNPRKFASHDTYLLCFLSFWPLQIVREEIKKFDKEVRDTVKAPHANISDW